MKAAKQQLAEWDKELNQLHERNGDLGLEVQNLAEQLEKERADRKETEDAYWDMEETLAELRSENSELAKTCDELRSELADLKQNSATASQDLPDLTEKAGELLSFFKSLLPKNTKLPNGIISKIEKILEG